MPLDLDFPLLFIASHSNNTLSNIFPHTHFFHSGKAQVEVLSQLSLFPGNPLEKFLSFSKFIQ